jgi:multiple sugar transport system substrate-binding protein
VAFAVGSVVAVLAIVAGTAFVGGAWRGSGGASPAASPTASGPVIVRWFISYSGGGMFDPPGREFAQTFNSSQSDFSLKLEMVPSSNAYDTLKADIAAGNAPDIIGPIGIKNRNGFEGLFLDLTTEIAKNHFDMTQYDPGLVEYVQQGAKGTIAIPYDIYPGYIWYNKDIFARNNLPPLPTKVGELYQGQLWTWQTLAKLAAGLTVDMNGKISTDPGFDAKNIHQYGMDFQWTGDLTRLASSFGSGRLVAPDGKTAQIPAAWASGLAWYYNAVHFAHIVPDGTAEGSTLLAGGNSQSSGNIAMNAAYGWSISSLASDAATAKVHTWDMGVWPSWNRVTSAPLDIDTFLITAATKHPDEAFKAMLAIYADPALMKMYGGEPARTADQAAYFQAFDATLAPIFPGNQVTWSVLDEDLKHANPINHEADMPNFQTSWNDASTELARLQNTAGLNIADELAAFKAELQRDFDAAQPLAGQ